MASRAVALLVIVGFVALFPLAGRADALPHKFFGLTPATTLSDGEYARMGAGEVGTLRVPFHWKDIQRFGPDSYDWGRLDRVIADATRNGMCVQPFILDVPAWLQQRYDAGYYPPFGQRGKTAWKNFLTTAVERYKPRSLYWEIFEYFYPDVQPCPIRAWQIWNEPSGKSYWRPNNSAPERYARFLQYSAKVVRSAYRGATVVAAGLFQAPQDGMRAEEFIPRFYDTRGVKRGFDAFAYHPYGRDLSGVLRQIKEVRGYMKEAGDEHTPLWITEIGWPTLHEVESGAFVKTEEEQSRLLERVFQRLINKRRRWKIDRLIWYTWRDNQLFPTCNLCRSAGLFREDLTPKPSWDTFVRFTGGIP